MADFITSDIHFGHQNIMKFCPESRARFNGDVDYMNEQIVKEWNQVVTPRDHTYILGDISFMNWEKTVAYVRRLNGSKTLIRGNHDHKLVNSKEFCDCFVDIQDYYSINVNKVKVVMFHYPICEWDQMHRGSVHFHGHTHGNKTGLEGSRALDVGMDVTGNVVMPMDVMIAKALKGEIRSHHQTGM
jgi:calcineurin-like phosphoesterase family protein